MEAISLENSDLLATAFKTLRKDDQEILNRFYVDGQAMEMVCQEMNLTPTQFRLRKSQAIAKFMEAGQKVLKPQRMPPNREEDPSNQESGMQKVLRALGRAAGMH